MEILFKFVLNLTQWVVVSDSRVVDRRLCCTMVVHTWTQESNNSHLTPIRLTNPM